MAIYFYKTDIGEIGIEERSGKISGLYFTGEKPSWDAEPIFIPCHRVIGASGKLTGYRGGIGLKKKLLDLEQIIK